MKIELTPIPMTRKEVLVATGSGALLGLFTGTFAIVVGAFAIAVSLWRKSPKLLMFSITTTLMGFASYLSTATQEFTPAPMLVSLPALRMNIIQKNIISKQPISKFQVVKDVPAKMDAGTVWFSQKDDQFEGYDGSNIVILG